MSSQKELRVRVVREAPLRPRGDHVLYWMTSARRPRWNRALSKAVAHAKALKKPLVVLEALRCGYRWASDRLHRFVIDGMADNAARFEQAGIAYLPYVEPVPDAGQGLLEAFAETACTIVTDEFPCFFLPRMLAAAGRKLSVRIEAVDGNGLLPLRAADAAFPTAHSFRRFIQRTLPTFAFAGIEEDPLARVSLPPPPASFRVIADRWRPARKALLDGDAALLSKFPIDHGVPPVSTRGGHVAAEAALSTFLSSRVRGYGEGRDDPDAGATSGLSPWLHFGHLSSEEVAHRLLLQEGCIPSRDLVSAGDGSKGSWWHVSPSAEAFLDQLVTWRELGFNACQFHPRDYDRYETLPPWARATLEKHARDPRDPLYDLPTLEGARTHDEVWNAAQRELVQDGRIHNALRMLWGKKILQWTRSPREALDVLVHLNNRHAVDGRDPSSYSNIFWVLGRYDRPWAPERPIFGVVRFMSSESAARKRELDAYLARYRAPDRSGAPSL